MAILCLAGISGMIWLGHRLWINNLTPEEREQREAKRQANANKQQMKAANSPPHKFLYGVGGTNNLPNPDYILWYQRRFGNTPRQDRDDGYDGFLE